MTNEVSSSSSRSQKRKKKRRNVLSLDPEMEKKIDAAVRIRTRMIVRDAMGNPTQFRSTIYQKEDEES